MVGCTSEAGRATKDRATPKNGRGEESGWPDLNRRPLDPQTTRLLSASVSLGRFRCLEGGTIEALADIEARIIAALEGLPEGLESRRAVGDAVGGNAESVSAAIRRLTSAGTLVVTKTGKRYVHRLAKYVVPAEKSPDDEWARIAG